MRNCTICGKPIYLNPSASERARKDTSGKSAQYYENLFTTHSDCQIKQWYTIPKVIGHIL